MSAIGHRAPDPIAAVIDHDARTVTVAVTFQFAGSHSVDKCDTGAFLGQLRRQLETAFESYDAVEGFSYTCWDPDEETDLGYLADYKHPVCAGCSKPVRPVDPVDRWRAPEWWEHVDFIDPDEPCDRLSGRSDETYTVRFPNLLAVNFERKQEQP